MTDEIDDGKVTHLVCTYRSDDEGLAYRCIGKESGTYIMGMMIRTIIHMHVTPILKGEC